MLGLLGLLAILEEPEQPLALGWSWATISDPGSWEALEMSRGNMQTALTSSRQAVQYFLGTGNMPALMAEEILFSHYEVLEAAGQPDSAAYLEFAYRILSYKLNNIADESAREVFLRRVTLNRRICEAKAVGGDMLGA